MVAVLELPRLGLDTDFPVDEVCHLFCSCNPDMSLCGVDISDEVESFNPPLDLVCKLCVELEIQPCQYCGSF